LILKLLKIFLLHIIHPKYWMAYTNRHLVLEIGYGQKVGQNILSRIKFLQESKSPNRDIVLHYLYVVASVSRIIPLVKINFHNLLELKDFSIQKLICHETINQIFSMAHNVEPVRYKANGGLLIQPDGKTI
jgi:hypothetical protein